MVFFLSHLVICMHLVWLQGCQECLPLGLIYHQVNSGFSNKIISPNRRYRMSEVQVHGVW